MGRGAAIADGLEALWRFFRGKPDFVFPGRTPPTTRPRPDPAPAPQRPRPDPDPEPLPPAPHRPPYVPRLHDDEPETEPEGQTEGETTTTTEDMQECETCPDCAPRKQGHAEFRPLTGTEASKISGATYQNWVIPWFRWVGNQQEEWRFSGVWFDGIDPAICQLIEAKGRYGFMFRDPSGFDPAPYVWALEGPIQRDKEEFLRQLAVIAPFSPQASLHWVMHTWAYNWHMFQYIRLFGPNATTEHRPYPDWNPND